MNNLINTLKLRKRKQWLSAQNVGNHFSRQDWFLHDFAETEILSRFERYSSFCVDDGDNRGKLKIARGFHKALDQSYVPISTFMDHNTLLCESSSLPFSDDCSVIFLDSMELYLYNDVVESLREVKRVLCPGGVYCCGFLGGNTAKHLRYKLIELESSLYGHASLKLIPTLRADMVAQLIQTVGFTQIVVESVNIEVDYASLESFIFDIRRCGENSIFYNSKRFYQRSLWESLKRTWKNIMPLDVEIIFIVAKA